MKNEIIAVDLGGTHLRVSKVNGKNILGFNQIETPKEKDKLLYSLTEMISALINKNTLGIGIGCAGFIQDGVVIKSPNLPLKNFDFVKFLNKKFKLPVKIINDAHAHALAELYYGVKKKDFVLLTLGTGIGGGIVLNGELQFRNGGGEVGHMIIDSGKDFETLAASKALKYLTRNTFGKEMMISELVARKDEISLKILEHLALYLGQGIANLCAIFNPQVVVLAGGMREGGSKFLKLIQNSYEKHNFLPKSVRVVWSDLEHPGTLGASLLFKE